jgi:hypothetical protein
MDVGVRRREMFGLLASRLLSPFVAVLKLGLLCTLRTLQSVISSSCCSA